MIRGGSLQAGDKLPSVRMLCHTRRVSPSTVLRAYSMLELAGLIQATPRSGYYVSARPKPPVPRPSMPTGEVHARGAALQTMCEVVGLLQDTPAAFFKKKKDRWLQQQGLTYEQVEEWITQRNQARKEKNWREADRIRQELHDNGIVIEDTPGGTLWKVK